MSEQAAQAAAVLPRALAEPSERVPARWVGGLSLASLAMWMGALVPANFLLPAQLLVIDPKASKQALGYIMAIATVAAVLATPTAGAISDRTTYAWSIGHLRGRRHRWTLLFAIGGSITLGLIGFQSTVLSVGVLWVAFNIFQNGEYATLSAATPDHVPVSQRATVSGWFSMPQALGLLIGGALVALVVTGQVSGYLTLAILLLIGSAPFALFTRDHPLAPEHRQPLTLRDLTRAFWISPRRYPDFGWAWITRFLVSLAIAMGTLYLLFFLHDVIHYSKIFPGQTDEQGLLILTAIYTLLMVTAAILGGMLSDRIGKRKVLVTVAGLLIGAAALLLTFVETWPTAIVAAVLYGLGFGCYLAADQALITQVLPAAADRCKDLGIINIAIIGPTALAGVISPALVALGWYPLLFGATTVIAFLGSVLVWKIKSVS